VLYRLGYRSIHLALTRTRHADVIP
jgi:hypothetical protein